MQHTTLLYNHDCHSYISTFNCTFLMVKDKNCFTLIYFSKQMPLFQQVAVAAYLVRHWLKFRIKNWPQQKRLQINRKNITLTSWYYVLQPASWCAYYTKHIALSALPLSEHSGGVCRNKVEMFWWERANQRAGTRLLGPTVQSVSNTSPCELDLASRSPSSTTAEVSDG